MLQGLHLYQEDHICSNVYFQPSFFLVEAKLKMSKSQVLKRCIVPSCKKMSKPSGRLIVNLG